MNPHEKFSKQLDRFWENADLKSSVFLSAESSENDGAEIIEYINAIVESAFTQTRIDQQQRALCLANLGRVSAMLSEKEAVAGFKKTMLELSPNQLLQSLLTFSDNDAKAMADRVSQSAEQYVELNPGNEAGTVCFLYEQLNGSAAYYDGHVDRTLPVNGDGLFCCYDNYFPIYKLMEKYFPRTTLRLITNPANAIGKYIYVVTFNCFPAFVLKNDNRFLSVIPQHILEDCRNGKAIIVYNDLAESTFYPSIIDRFEKQLHVAGIINSFFVLSGDFANESLQRATTLVQKIRRLTRSSGANVKLYVISYFEEATAYSKKTNYPVYTYDSKLDFIKRHVESLRHFVCLNRAVKDYRVYISYFFSANNLLDKAYVSQYPFTDNKEFEFGYNQNKALWDNVDGAQFEKFRQSLPWYIDFEDMKSYPWDAVPIEVLNNSFCWVTTETSFGDIHPDESFRLTEKTYKPIAFFMPFIMVGNPFLLKKLHEKGYQTFSRWWDESYDTVVDPIKRMEKITEVIMKISSLSQQELIAVYEEMKPALIHNYQLLMKSNSGKQAMQAIRDASTKAI
jgi:hypothetical protein